ncbi:DUF2306 domain-containing protein [Psychrosphaera sp. 1_MG-2023]|uniref:DUF2306 domain-containing protein n=1 Tax=Psychrosphaera sp. 1_MG-2023 TaxID=3062643 RepID=UPI0026E48EAD|nr:DUF2306 domain-containing protein [Psychrosphaera sp. 1_MG-2023]MDO6721473.1 DUF2306 domain-containing protein [Psychrosphaera sp. 1_MG-2023]
MTYIQLAYLHLATVVPAFFLGTYILFIQKGTPKHKMLGKLYVSFMLATAFITLFMPAVVGPTILNHFGFIHLLSVLVFVTVPLAILAIRKGDVGAHKRHMLGMYVGALLIAGSLAMMPGRMMHTWLFT